MRQAIVLAAGEGQRLRPFTVFRPKVMLSIADKPILQYVIEALAANGIREIVCVVGYRKEQIYDYMGAGEHLGVNIKYICQGNQLGTAHALSLAKEAAQDEFLVLSGDNLIEAATIAGFTGIDPAAMLLKRVENPTRYGVVKINGGYAQSIVEKPREADGSLVNTGIYSFKKDVFDYIGNLLDIPDVLNNMINRGYNIRVLETPGTWLDIIYPWDILRLNDAVLGEAVTSVGGTIETNVTINGRVSIGKGTIVRSNTCIQGPAIIGSNCVIGPHACIMPDTSIGDNVSVWPFSEVRHSVVGDHVNIGPGSIVEDSVIDRGCSIKGRFTSCGGQSEVKVNGETPTVNVGAMIGERCTFESNVVALPGVIVGNHCQVQAMKLISGQLPDRSLIY